MPVLVAALAFVLAGSVLAEEPPKKRERKAIVLEQIEVDGEAHKPSVQLVIPRNPEARRAVDSAGGDALEKALERR